MELAVTRFLADLARVLPEGPTPGEPLALAVSGGPDSMAMLWLAATALPGRVIAATVDHGFRPDAAAEADLVAVACATLNVPHATLRPDRPIAGGNRHAAARLARYALLGRWAVHAGARVLATAHHADDQAETFLMRAVRGSGPAGLAGIRRRYVMPIADTAATITVVRPLLDWRRADLAAVVAAAGLPSVDDPSNADARFERSRVRRLLAAQPWLDATGLARAARHVGEADAALAATVDWLWRTRRIGGPAHQLRLDVADLPRELCRRLARDAIRAVRMTPDFDPATNIEPLLDALAAGKPATQADVLVTPRGTIWHFAPAPRRRTR